MDAPPPRRLFKTLIGQCRRERTPENLVPVQSTSTAARIISSLTSM